MHVLEPQPNEDGEVILFKKAWLPAGPNESVTVMVKLGVTAALCAPEITPQEHLSVVAVAKLQRIPPKYMGEFQPCAACLGNMLHLFISIVVRFPGFPKNLRCQSLDCMQNSAESHSGDPPIRSNFIPSIYS